MDFGTTLKHIAPFLIPLFALLIPLLAISINGWTKVRRNRELHESVRQISASGQPVPQELLEALRREGREEPRSSSWTPAANLRGGVINVGIGVGLVIFLYQMQPGGWLWAVGAIPLCLGIALLVAWRLEQGAAGTSDTRSIAEIER